MLLLLSGRVATGEQVERRWEQWELLSIGIYLHIEHVCFKNVQSNALTLMAKLVSHGCMQKY